MKLKASLFSRQISFSPKIIILILALTLTSCGFHLRGAYDLPPFMHYLTITPYDPYSPFQRVLRITLKQAGIEILSTCDNQNVTPSSLNLIDFKTTERVIAYGADTQINRAIIQLSFCYTVTDSKGNILIPSTRVQVNRELTVNPNAVLGTEYERNRLYEELFQDASAQLLRQLSAFHHANQAK